MTVLEKDQEIKSEPAIAGWFADPQGAHKLRYFDGDTWTDHVTHFGPTPCEGCSPR